MSTPPFVLRPPGVERVEVATNRGKLAALSAAAIGPAVICVPGFTGSKEDFIAILKPLRDLGWSVLAIDQMGQFESEGPDTEHAYSLDALADDLISVATGVRGPVHLVGHSLGGLVCREAVIARADLFASVTLLGSGPGPLPVDAHAMLKALRAAVPRMSMERIWQVKEERDRGAGIPAPPAGVAEFLRARWLRTNPWALAAKARLLMEAPDRTDELRFAAQVGAVRIMVAFGSGDQDAWPPPAQRQMAARLGATCVEIPGAGHSPAAENPSGTVSVLNGFWRED